MQNQAKMKKTIENIKETELGILVKINKIDRPLPTLRKTTELPRGENIVCFSSPGAIRVHKQPLFIRQSGRRGSHYYAFDGMTQQPG